MVPKDKALYKCRLSLKLPIVVPKEADADDRRLGVMRPAHCAGQYKATGAHKNIL